MILNDERDRIKKERAIADFKVPSQEITGGNKYCHKSLQAV
jgi:hypothetical protein